MPMYLSDPFLELHNQVPSQHALPHLRCVPFPEVLVTEVALYLFMINICVPL